MELPLVVGIDGSDPSLTAVDWAADEAARLGVPLCLVYASSGSATKGTCSPAASNAPRRR